MLRSHPPAPHPDPTQLTEEELHGLAAHVVDYLLSPLAAPWRQGFSATQRNPALLKVAVESLGFRQGAQDIGWLTKFAHAVARTTTWSLPRARPISCNDCPAFQRLQRSALCAAESFHRLACIMNTTFREKIYTRWCCIDRLNRHGFSESRSVKGEFPSTPHAPWAHRQA